MPKKGKSKKEKGPKVSYYEAILGYKIGLNEKELEDANFALKELSEKNSHFQQRNKRLTETRDYYIQKTIQENKEFLDQIDKQDKCEKQHVLKEMQNFWDFKKGLEDQIIDIKTQIKDVENDIVTQKREIRFWNYYKQKGRSEYDMQIRLLKQEIDQMNENFEIMADHIQSSLVNTKDIIEKSTAETVIKEHKSAADKIFKEMDKYTIQMMHDNKWMTEKVRLYRDEERELFTNTSAMEKDNIALMARLFECNTADLKCIKDEFLSQFLDNENLEQNNILDIDLSKLDTLRPKSGLDMALERVTKYKTNDDSLEEENDQNLSERTEHFFIDPEHCLNLGPFEYKSLSLHGIRKQIIKPKSPNTEEIKTQDYKEDEWPITQDMLQMALES